MYAFISGVPGNETIYHEVKKRMGDEVPGGLIAHLVVKIENGLRHVHVRETPEAWDRDETVEPAVAAVMRASAASADDVGEPVWSEIETLDASVGAMSPGGGLHTLLDAAAHGAMAEVAE